MMTTQQAAREISRRVGRTISCNKLCRLIYWGKIPPPQKVGDWLLSWSEEDLARAEKVFSTPRNWKKRLAAKKVQEVLGRLRPNDPPE